MWQVAIRSFAVAESAAASGDPGLADAVGNLSPEGLRLALRYLASEVNRLFFVGWGWIQIPLAATVLLLARFARSGRGAVAVAAAAFVIVIVLASYVVPETVHLGRMMDFAPETDLPDVRDRFWLLHHTYTGLDMLKLVLCLAAVGLVCRSSCRKSTAT